MLEHLRALRAIKPWDRHGLVLLVAGLVYIVVGFIYIDSTPTVAQRQALHFVLEFMPIQGWGVVFILAGLTAIVSTRWPPVSDNWAYPFLTGLSSGWGAAYFGGVFWAHAPHAALSTGAIFGLLGFMWWAISGLLSPVKKQ